MNNLTKCDKCGKDFIINLENRTINEGLDNEKIKIFFTCPHCNAEYLCYFENKYTMYLQAQIDKCSCTEIKRIKKLRDTRKKVLNKLNEKVKNEKLSRKSN
jgi:glutaredoxin-related protein